MRALEAKNFLVEQTAEQAALETCLFLTSKNE